jgi:hypothetical protein
MQILPFKTVFAKKTPPLSEATPDYARLIVDHLSFIERQYRRTFEFPGSYRSEAAVDNDADHSLTEVLDHLKADDFKAPREFRGTAKLTTYLTTVISNLIRYHSHAQRTFTSNSTCQKIRSCCRFQYANTEQGKGSSCKMEP